MYFIENKWLGFSQEVNQGTRPTILDVRQDPEFKLKPLRDIGNVGIYTGKEMKSAHDTLIFG